METRVKRLSEKELMLMAKKVVESNGEGCDDTSIFAIKEEMGCIFKNSNSRQHREYAMKMLIRLQAILNGRKPQEELLEPVCGWYD